MASFYDQNHESNHKNSMAGQSVLLDLDKGDRIQVYMFTDTGLQVIIIPMNLHLIHVSDLFSVLTLLFGLKKNYFLEF